MYLLDRVLDGSPPTRHTVLEAAEHTQTQSHTKTQTKKLKMASEEFNFTSEERRLIHSFDDNGRWIRCLPCYEYARTLKKGSNNANIHTFVGKHNKWF